jgi:uracil-DNA glycosylase
MVVAPPAALAPRRTQPFAAAAFHAAGVVGRPLQRAAGIATGPTRVNRREAYLAALGLDEWKPRVRAPEAHGVAGAAAADSPAPAAAPPGAEAWSVLEAEVSTCTRCALHQTRRHTVFGVGNRSAELLVIGEAPGADEDMQGEPFVGRAGQLLDAMLRALGSPRETVFIANVLKCRPPGNRDPKPEEVECCLPYLQRQIQLLQPRLMLAVGRIAAQNLLATDTPIGRLRGSVHHFGPARTPLIVTYHPAYLLRSPLEKRKAWTDLKFVRAQLEQMRQAAGEDHGRGA